MPSFTEGFPKVILECLSRNRPIIVFEEIKHVAKSFNGVFVCKRNNESFKETLNYIFSNYLEILQQIKKNKLPTKKNFQKKLIKLI